MSDENPENDKRDYPLITSPEHPWRTSDPDIHPEAFCHRCRGRNVVWLAEDNLWNDVMRDGSIDGQWRWNEIICPICFIELAREKGYKRRTFATIYMQSVDADKQNGTELKHEALKMLKSWLLLEHLSDEQLEPYVNQILALVEGLEQGSRTMNDEPTKPETEHKCLDCGEEAEWLEPYGRGDIYTCQMHCGDHAINIIDGRRSEGGYF